ncbi:catalase [Paenalcaligenes niemegkensis]|uniref:catalase n=1 Tax=Paenalcaligenes niemegkensis TaxID=2895469 RepID=UPI001EE7DD7D|nr:catalase [Paenalcaligenes niemegkensis]MCQ9616369.1 catalase [Paenalcaligenes niemegkensis]
MSNQSEKAKNGNPSHYSAKTGAGTTDSGPPSTLGTDKKADNVIKATQTQDVAAKFPYNQAKSSEYADSDEGSIAAKGQSATVGDHAAGSTLSDKNTSEKYSAQRQDLNPQSSLSPYQQASANTGEMTTNQGVVISDNQNSLKAGARGPALLKDFILREKITHFDHERIPERVVHARGSGAHGVFQSYGDFSDITIAAPFLKKGKQTPVFVRFSTVAGERGSKDTPRDVRGFAVKFYTDQGNWDLVGNNMPVFFIQDAMKFPDLVHAVKPEPNHGMPQAASAHDTFWDFVSLMPESLHTVFWLMSDRALPRSLRMMQGFGVHTFRFINQQGKSSFVKFHWNPSYGTHAQVWDEAVKTSGADPDFHRRDLWEAIESGHYPEWELCVQIFDEEQAESFSFDILDSTKIIPEELVPLTPIGKMTLNRNPDNFFAETEQVAFCTANVVPGIDFTNDPLLAGRIHSYADTQLSRLGGPNFHELPINAPITPIRNNQRDGMHRQAIHQGRAAYEPNSLGGGCPFQAGSSGYVAFPEPVNANETRVKPEKFAEHYNQPALFYHSQTPAEQAHIAAAFRFELSKVTVPAIRERMISMLMNVDTELAENVAGRLGVSPLPTPMVKATEQKFKPELTESPPLSMTARPGDEKLKTRKVAILVTKGVDGAQVKTLANTLMDQGLVVRLIGPYLGEFESANGPIIISDASFENSPSVLFDAVALVDGLNLLAQEGLALEHIRDAYRHCKPIYACGASTKLLGLAGIPDSEINSNGVLSVKEGSDDHKPFIEAIAKGRFFEREQERPRV